MPSIALARSFYAEFAVVRGDVDEARRRRSDLLSFYEGLPHDPFVEAVRAYSRAKLAGLDGDLSGAERHYRSAAAGFARLDRPVMLSIALGTVADFDERAGDYAAAAERLTEAIATNDAIGLRGYTDSLLARLGWVLLHEGDPEGAEALYERALDGAGGFATRRCSASAFDRLGRGAPTPWTHRSRPRASAMEALEFYVAGGPRRFRNRIDPNSDMLEGAAACCSVLAALAGDAGEWERAARLLGHAERLRDGAGVPVPAFQREDVESTHLAVRRALGEPGLVTAFEQGRHGDLAVELGVETA